MEINITAALIDHLRLSLLPTVAALLFGGALGYLMALGLRPVLARSPGLLKLGALVPWRTASVVLAVLALTAPWVVRIAGWPGPRIGLGGAQLVLGLALLALAVPFVAHTCLASWFPAPLASRLIDSARTLGILGIALAVQTGPLFGQGGAGFLINQGANLLDWPLVVRGAAILALLTGAVDTGLGLLAAIGRAWPDRLESGVR